MKAQQEIVTLFFSFGDRVKWVQPKFDMGKVSTGVTYGRVHMECPKRPAFYYVRSDADKSLYLVHWTDLERA